MEFNTAGLLKWYAQSLFACFNVIHFLRLLHAAWARWRNFTSKQMLTME